MEDTFYVDDLRNKIIGCLGLEMLEDTNKKEDFVQHIINHVIKNDLLAYGLSNVEFVFKDEYDIFYKGVEHSIFSSPFNNIYIIILK